MMNQSMGQPISSGKREVATLGGGCFWCLEAVFDNLKGVTDVVSGYAGGQAANPSYEQVCTGRTGHAEVVQVTFDPQQINFREILEVFFTVHDPTTLNRQGADVGTQYRSAIFYHSDEQKTAAEEVERTFTAEKVWGKPIVTELKPFLARTSLSMAEVLEKQGQHSNALQAQHSAEDLFLSLGKM